MRTVEYKSRGEVKTKEVPFLKLLQDLAQKRATSLKNFSEKEKDDDDSPITLDQFSPAMIKLDPDEEVILKDELEVNGEITYPKAESKYYGFQWTHILETCKGYGGHTIDELLEDSTACGPIEVQIKAVKKRVSKPKSPDKPGVEFWSIDVEDANARRMFVNIWKEDYTRWQNELVVDNLVCMRVRPPSGGFNTMTFESFSRKEKGKKPLTKEEDYRLIVLELPEKKPQINLDDLQFDLLQ